jgi:antitoxin CptB
MARGPSGAARARLAWRCRRGTRELDLLLLRWLQHGYGTADDARRALFETLLELPDPELAGYLLGDARPAQPALGELIDAIRCVPPGVATGATGAAGRGLAVG